MGSPLTTPSPKLWKATPTVSSPSRKVSAALKPEQNTDFFLFFSFSEKKRSFPEKKNEG